MGKITITPILSILLFTQMTASEIAPAPQPSKAVQSDEQETTNKINQFIPDDIFSKAKSGKKIKKIFLNKPIDYSLKMKIGDILMQSESALDSYYDPDPFGPEGHHIRPRQLMPRIIKQKLKTIENTTSGTRLELCVVSIKLAQTTDPHFMGRIVATVSILGKVISDSDSTLIGAFSTVISGTSTRVNDVNAAMLYAGDDLVTQLKYDIFNLTPPKKSFINRLLE